MIGSLLVPAEEGRYFLLPDDVSYFDALPEPTSEHHVGRFGLAIHPDVVTVTCIGDGVDVEVDLQVVALDAAPGSEGELMGGWDVRVDATWIVVRPGVVASGSFDRQGILFDSPGRYHLALFGRLRPHEGAASDRAREEHQLLIWPAGSARS
ncbi:hypothetical protein F9L07_01050 [Pimelobacter simplex]|uniref:Uncharacterized protein n=1 Tax=Nocardioides simplex TaxID=2045 RepID=A0A7J5DX28_NOCSI|nr:hypothetical protein [Pimelobacter simplex]KAB2810586.1 hypothetical protein F9L07_01050 [Pimelobacter simplex]